MIRKRSGRSVAKLSTLDVFLKADDKLEEFEAVAIKEVIAWQIAQAMSVACEPRPLAEGER